MREVILKTDGNKAEVIKCYEPELGEFNWLKYVETFGEMKWSNKVNNRYLNVIITFDIETTSYVHVQIGKMYIWSMCVGGVELIGRTWQGFVDTLNEMYRRFKNSIAFGNNFLMVVWVHNLAFEFQFMQDFFDEWTEVFAKAPRKIVRGIANNMFEFRCSYMLCH